MNAIAPFDGLETYFAVMSFLFGTFFGSFFNVCIYRLPINKSIVVPASHCYHCGTFLSWRDNIPLLSYLLLRGNCRFCGIHFSPRYFFVELLTGFLFLFVYLQFGVGWALLFHWAFVGLLIVGTFTDIDHFILPDGITKGGTVFAIVTALILGRESLIADEWRLSRDIFDSFRAVPLQAGDIAFYAPFAWSVVSALFGWGMLAGIGFIGRILFRKEAMGGGDVKLFAFLGAYMGLLNCVWILFLSALLGSCVGLTLILIHKLMRTDEYEEFELLPDKVVKSQTRRVVPMGERDPAADSIVVAESISPASAELSEPATEGGAPANSAISLRVPRRTARQLHHFPYGPYIAVAALIVLLFHREIDALTREYFFLQPVRNVEVKVGSTGL